MLIYPARGDSNCLWPMCVVQDSRGFHVFPLHVTNDSMHNLRRVTYRCHAVRRSGALERESYNPSIVQQPAGMDLPKFPGCVCASLCSLTRPQCMYFAYRHHAMLPVAPHCSAPLKLGVHRSGLRQLFLVRMNF